MTKILVLFYSTFGHTYRMARAVAKGAEKVRGTNVVIKRVAETLSDEIIEKMGATEKQKEFAHIPIIQREELAEYDAIIFGTPARFGNMAAQMRAFLDSTGGIWNSHALVGKVGSVFTSTNTQHGGQESTILSFHITLLHHGMLIAGLPYAWQGQSRMDEITGGSPYGASTIAGKKGSRTPSENELEGASYQGEYVAKIASKLTR